MLPTPVLHDAGVILNPAFVNYLLVEPDLAIIDDLRALRNDFFLNGKLMESYIVDVEQEDFFLLIVVQRKLPRLLDGFKHDWEYKWRVELLANNVFYHMKESQLDTPFFLKVLCCDHVYLILLYCEEVLLPERRIKTVHKMLKV